MTPLVVLFLGGVFLAAIVAWLRALDRLMRELAKVDDRWAYPPDVSPILHVISTRSGLETARQVSGMLRLHLTPQDDPRLEALRWSAIRRGAFAFAWLLMGWIPTTAILVLVVALLSI